MSARNETGRKFETLSEFLAAIPFDAEAQYFVVVHSVRCTYHQAAPVTVTRARETLWSKILRCDDPECYIATADVKIRRRGPTHGEAAYTWRKTTGHPLGWVSREERRKNASYADPKNTREMAMFLARRGSA